MVVLTPTTVIAHSSAPTRAMTTARPVPTKTAVGEDASWVPSTRAQVFRASERWVRVPSVAFTKASRLKLLPSRAVRAAGAPMKLPPTSSNVGGVAFMRTRRSVPSSLRVSTWVVKVWL